MGISSWNTQSEGGDRHTVIEREGETETERWRQKNKKRMGLDKIII